MKIAITLTAIALLVASTATASSIVLNGSFEDPALSGNYYLAVNAGQTTLTDWTVGLTSIDIVANNQGGGNNWAIDGNQAVDMAGTPGPGSISQVLNTNPNAFYTLSFQVSSNGPAITNGLEVYWNGVLTDTISSPAQGTWGIYTYTVQALNASTLLKFDTPLTGNAGPLLDNVSVSSAVPEPSTFLLFGAGLIGVGLLRKRFSK